MLVKCKFLDENSEPKGREYTYGSNDEVIVGEIVTTEEGKKLVVTSTDVDEAEGAKFGDKLKYINAIIDGEAVEGNSSVAPEIQELIVVKQLPVIEERLKSLSDDIDFKVSDALALPCSNENVKAVKAARAELNKTFEALEEQRKGVKNAIMTPYEQFNEIYKKYVSEKIKSADDTLKERINGVENELKSAKENEVKTYFNECLQAQDIDFVSYERAGINVTLSASLKSLKEQAKAFVDRIASDVDLIETQEHKEEILVEYHKSLNCSQAITSVVARHKAAEELKAKQAEMEAKKQAVAEAVKKVEAVASPLAPPTQAQPQAAEQTRADLVKTLIFSVTAPLSKLKELKQFLIEGGYTYE